MKTLFVSHKFKPSSLLIIEKANEILADYESQGLILTLRQLYYQFVARGIVDNKQTEYDKIGAIISDARLAGLVDWSLMEDRTRSLRRITHWETPQDIISAVAQQYKEDLWRDQEVRIEAWIEKDALVGVIEKVCREMRIEYFACRGYSSQSAQYEAGQRLARYRKAGQMPVILHLGDHDPSGMDMSRDNEERLSMFAGGPIELRRLALNMDQIQKYSPPPNPAKETDSRAKEYIRKYGNESWELDALEPSMIDKLIRDEVLALRDEDKWEAAEQEEEEHRAALQLVSDRWRQVQTYVKTTDDGWEKVEPKPRNVPPSEDE